MRPPLLALALLLLLPVAAGARVGTLDPRFGVHGSARLTFDVDEAVPVAIAPDGAGGLYVLADDARRGAVARLSARGRPDRTFGDQGLVTPCFAGCLPAPGQLVGLARRATGGLLLLEQRAEGTVADPRGRVYVLTRRELERARGPRLSIIRFAGAHIDRSFGRRGVLVLAASASRPLMDGVLALDSAHHRLWLAADEGDGLSSIRDDFGKDRVLVRAIRLR